MKRPSSEVMRWVNSEWRDLVFHDDFIDVLCLLMANMVEDDEEPQECMRTVLMMASAIATLDFELAERWDQWDSERN